MPARNASRFIIEAIESVRLQTFQDWQLIVVDDGSTDDTAFLVARAAEVERRIVLLPSEGPGIGAALARNRALDIAGGQFIAFLDADDSWVPDKLERQTNFLTDASLKTNITYGEYWRVDESGRRIGFVEPPAILTFGDLLRSNHIGNLTAMYELSAFPDIRFEDVGSEDHLFWLRALAQSHASAHITPGRRALGTYRVRKGSLSSNKLLSVRRQWSLYRRSLQIDAWRSGIYLVSYASLGIMKRLRAKKRPMRR